MLMNELKLFFRENLEPLPDKDLIMPKKALFNMQFFIGSILWKNETKQTALSLQRLPQDFYLQATTCQKTQ